VVDTTEGGIVLLRRIARPLFAAWFVAEGLDAALHPAGHVERLRAGVRALATYVPGDVDLIDRLTAVPTERLTLGARAYGAATALAGLAFALGRNPRSAATALVLLVAPTVVADIPPLGLDRGPTAERRDRRERLVRAVAFIGGAALAAADTHGQPGLGYRLRAARDARAAAADGS
jgi:uncharacterized membrane protein YphA (DoxX/SURF4 family)